MKLHSLKEIKNLKGKRVLVRVDFNVPIKAGRVLNAYKIRCSLPTIQYLLKKGANIVLVSHLGRPSGFDTKLSLAPVAKELEQLLGEKVEFVKIKRLEDLKIVEPIIGQMQNGSVLMLENIRFLAGEEKNDPKLAKALASLADVFVLDGFAVAHRDAASVTGVARHLPSYAGMLLFEEVVVLSKVMAKPKRPLVVLLGGAKVETKIPVLKELLPRASHVLVGGGVANTYFWANGAEVGRSLVGREYKKEILTYCRNKKVIMPVDVVVGEEDGKNARVMAVADLVPGALKGKSGIYDIGPKTAQLFAAFLKKAQTIVWNGAMGMFEVRAYKYGTYASARLFAARSKGKAFGVAGGGETVEVLEKLGLANDVDWVSTGGGAMLEFLSGKKLPGLKKLQK